MGSLFSSAYVCVKKGIARTKVVRKDGKEGLQVRDGTDANARVSGRGGDKLTTGVQE